MSNPHLNSWRLSARHSWMAVVLLVTVSCAGSISGGADSASEPGDDFPAGGDSPRPGAGGSDASPGPAANCQASAPAPAPLRRLTRQEYVATVRSLLGLDAQDLSFAPDTRTLGFDNLAVGQAPSAILAEQYEAAAATLAARAVANLSALLQCDTRKDGEDACATRFIESFGKRAFRRPLTKAERDRHVSFYSARKTESGFAGAMELLISAFLHSPHFLYRVELGDGSGTDSFGRLTGFELATRLSYLLWGTMPDDSLIEAAESGKLQTPAQVAEQAKRMFEDPRSRLAVARFHTQWLHMSELDHINKDKTIYPSFRPELRALWAQETAMFLEQIVWGGRPFSDIFVAEHSYMNAELAAFYGVKGPTGSAFEEVSLAGTPRQGFLTQAGFLAVHAKDNQSSPIDRGKFVREQLFCQPLPLPPNNLDISVPDVQPGATTRQRFLAHTENNACAACHTLIDPIGFGLEAFDGMGAYRTMDQGLPVDDSGELIGTDVDGKYRGAKELSTKLASSREVRACLATQWFRYAHGRQEESGDACDLEFVTKRFEATGSVADLLVALTQTPAFLTFNPGGK